MTAKIKNLRVVVLLSVVVIAMFGFGFAMVPLYNAFCKVTGLNGKTALTRAYPATATDTTRTITMQFTATGNANIPWDFDPEQKSLDIHPGENTQVTFYVKNNSHKTMTVQAIPSISPGNAARYLKKLECFCFTKQTLAAGAALHMPVLFYLDKDLPKNIPMITLSYTLFDVTPKG